MNKLGAVRRGAARNKRERRKLGRRIRSKHLISRLVIPPSNYQAVDMKFELANIF